LVRRESEDMKEGRIELNGLTAVGRDGDER
jgi:hypothetical protein